jgi:hypothetical protein
MADRIIACAPGTWREIQIRTLRNFLSIRTQDMDLAEVVFVKYIFESVYFFLNNPEMASVDWKLGWLAIIYC